MCAYTVYKHTSPSGKVYIGITSLEPEIRWGKDGFGYRKQPYFYRAIQKYGWGNIQHEILFEGLTKDEACAKEIELIAMYKSNDSDYGYNLSLGGESGGNGIPLSDEERRRLSERMRGDNNPSRRFPFSEERRKAMSEISKNRPLPPEFIAQQSAPKVKLRKPVAKYTLNGEFITEYISALDASKACGIHQGNISACCNGRIKQSGGFIWKYIDK